MKKLIGIIALAAAGCSPKFGLFGPQQVDRLDGERRTVAIATTNRLSSSWLAATEMTNYLARVTGKVVGVEKWKSGKVEKCGIVIGILADLGAGRAGHAPWCFTDFRSPRRPCGHELN